MRSLGTSSRHVCCWWPDSAAVQVPMASICDLHGMCKCKSLESYLWRVFDHRSVSYNLACRSEVTRRFADVCTCARSLKLLRAENCKHRQIVLSYLRSTCKPIDHTDCSRRSEPPIAENFSFCSLLFNSYSRLLLNRKCLVNFSDLGLNAVVATSHQLTMM